MFSQKVDTNIKMNEDENKKKEEKNKKKGLTRQQGNSASSTHVGIMKPLNFLQRWDL